MACILLRSVAVRVHESQAFSDVVVAKPPQNLMKRLLLCFRATTTPLPMTTTRIAAMSTVQPTNMMIQNCVTSLGHCRWGLDESAVLGHMTPIASHEVQPTQCPMPTLIVQSCHTWLHAIGQFYVGSACRLPQGKYGLSWFLTIFTFLWFYNKHVPVDSLMNSFFVQHSLKHM